MTVHHTTQPRAQAGTKPHPLAVCERLSSRLIISLRTIVRKDRMLILLTSYRSAPRAHIHGPVLCEIRTNVCNVHIVTFERSFAYRPHVCFLLLILNTILRTFVRNYPFQFSLCNLLNHLLTPGHTPCDTNRRFEIGHANSLRTIVRIPHAARFIYFGHVYERSFVCTTKVGLHPVAKLILD